MKLRCEDTAQLLEAMRFNVEAGTMPPSRVRAVFQLDVNDWNGAQTLRSPEAVS